MVYRVLLKIRRSESLMTLIRKIKARIIRKTGLSFSNYPGWILANEPKEEQLAKQRTTGRNFDYQPLISLIVPVWNTPGEILNQTITSVIQQTYENWELCMADGASTPDTRKLLSDWAEKDNRIKIKSLEENNGIAVNSNGALSLARGEFVAFLDHDDLLAPFALFEIVGQLQGNATVDVIYSDEDKIDKSGRRFEPFFKPCFSPDYLRSVNYMPHFLVVRKSLGNEIGWFREGYDGAQDYDLILRLVEKARSITHIPKILYHWRVWPASTASGSDAKPHANEAGKKALQEHLKRIGFPSARVEDAFYPTFYQVRYKLNCSPLVSIIIPNKDHALELEQCINSILQKTVYPHFEIILIENSSREQKTLNLYNQLEKDSRIHLVEWNEPFNYSRLNNWAVRQAKGEIVLFLNNDTQVINIDWLERMLQFAMRPDTGVVGAKLYYPDKSIQHAGVVIGMGGIAGHVYHNFPRQHTGYFGQLMLPHNVSAVTGACMMMRKQIFQEVNGFDENYALAFGDVDLCLSILQKGHLNIWTPYAELYHHESKTRGYEDSPEKLERFNHEVNYFKRKWPEWLKKGDMYYNPNLALSDKNFSINPNPGNVLARIREKTLPDKLQ
jgi:O-antigen biosynthesis protein